MDKVEQAIRLVHALLLTLKGDKKKEHGFMLYATEHGSRCTKQISD